MPNESYFMAFGGLGLTLAGFAGLINALSPRSLAASPVAVYRVRTIVILGLWVTVVGLGTVAFYSLLAPDVALTVRIATLVMALAFVRGLLIDTRPGPAWPSETDRYVTIGILVVLLAITLGNVVVASVGYLQVVLLLGLIGPLTIFYNTIKETTVQRSNDEDAKRAPKD